MEIWRLKLTSAKVEVEVEAELGKRPPPPNILTVTDPNLTKILNIGFREHLEQIPTDMVTFVQATFVLAKFVHIRNISAVADSFLTKL